MGLVLGGTILLEGTIPFLGEKSKMRAAGGIAGALIGFAIAHFAEPHECEAKAAIILKGFPSSGSVSVSNEGNKKREYIVLYDTTSSAVTTSIERTNDGATRDLKFRFGSRSKSKDGFKIVLQFFRSDLEGKQKFEFAWRCTIGAEIGVPPSAGLKYQLIASEPLRYEVEFNQNFFKEVEEALKKGANEADVMCFKGRSRLGGDGPLIEARVGVPFYVSRLRGYFGQELWYVVQTSTAATPQSVARQPEVVNGELSVGDKAQSSASSPLSPKAVSDVVSTQVSRQVVGCSATDDQRRALDSFIGGDDLDINKRKELYSGWKDVHCYVWPLVKTGASIERSRALKFTANAIINNSLEANLVYWQPAGSNKRDFAKPLPLFVDGDYRAVFDLLKSDDLAVRNEATRFIRNLPVDKFAQLFNEQIDKIEQLTAAQRERFSIAASFLHYGRIVEWLDVSKDESAKTASSIGVDFKASQRWTSKANLADSAKAYEAMLWYAKAIVEREIIKNDDLAKGSFRQVTDAVSLTAEPYPSNPLHIGQAVAVTFANDSSAAQLILREIRTSETYASSTPLSYPNAPKSAVLSAGPGESFQRTPAKTFTNFTEARMLLRKGDWIFVQFRDQLGWIKREVKVVGGP